MRPEFRNLVDNRKRLMREGAIKARLECIRDDIECCMEEEIDLDPLTWPVELVDALSKLHAMIGAVKK